MAVAVSLAHTVAAAAAAAPAAAAIIDKNCRDSACNAGGYAARERGWLLFWRWQVGKNDVVIVVVVVVVLEIDMEVDFLFLRRAKATFVRARELNPPLAAILWLCLDNCPGWC